MTENANKAVFQLQSNDLLEDSQIANTILKISLKKTVILTPVTGTNLV